ncbi:MAG: hypothetical protein NUW06_01620 [Candidatus Acetothermia bacterium]|jgi:hypothetical protein|nr:hypothetical protein [Candidatus Acetothermia bacterium]MDH7505312.1 hypothetical protein [Candidatus Acetothermia bacterium]
MKSRWVLGIPAVVAVAVLVVVLWPTGDPFAGVETVAIQGPDWGRSAQDELIQGPFIEGLEITLDEKNIRIVGNVNEADAVLAIRDLKLGKIELTIEGGQVRGRASATCVLKNLKTNEEYLLDFYLTLEDSRLEARLETRKFWQFWK